MSGKDKIERFEWTPKEIRDTAKRFVAGESISQMAEELGRTPDAVRQKMAKEGLRWGQDRKRGSDGGGFRRTTEIPTPNRSLDQIMADQAERYAAKTARYGVKHTGIHIELDEPGPYGILFFGDPHADDDGCDLERLAYDMKVVQDTPHLYGACIGDLTNNWLRVLGHLYAHQHTTDDEAAELLKWVVSNIDWMFIVLGNHDCLDVATECLTIHGWKKYRELSTFDRVLGVNPETNRAEWQAVNEVIIRPHVGKMHRTMNSRIDILCTPNHRIAHRNRKFVNRMPQFGDMELLESEAIQQGKRIALDVSGYMDRPGVPLSDEHIMFTAWLLTDGHVCMRNGAPYTFNFTQRESNAHMIRDMLNALGLQFSKRIRYRDITHICGKELKQRPQPSHEFHLSADSTREMMKTIPGKGIIPAWAELMDDRQFEIFLSTLIEADGSQPKHTDKSAVLYGPEEFLDQVQALCALFGVSAHKKIARPGDVRLNICRNTSTTQFDYQPEIVEDYDGDVWCLRVQHQNFLVRRNGKMHFTGNCWSSLAKTICDERGVTHVTHGAIFKIDCGDHSLTVDARHTHKGNSMYNPAHAQLKRNHRGSDADIIVAGHTHQSAYTMLKNGVTGKIGHAIRVGAYKKADEYADMLGLDDECISPSVLCIVNPDANDEGIVNVFHDIDTGLVFLDALRSRYEKFRALRSRHEQSED